MRSLRFGGVFAGAGFAAAFGNGVARGQEAGAPSAMIAKLCLQGLAMMAARRLDVLQGDGLPAMLRGLTAAGGKRWRF